MEKTKFMIYSIHHCNENYPAYQNEVVTPIIAGKRPNPERTDIDTFDDTGDNIVERHDTFSEFTAAYWMWKNSDAECIGLMHYRRALNFAYESEPSGLGFCQAHGLTRKYLEGFFETEDIAVGEPMNFGNLTIFEQYKACHSLFADEVFADIRTYLQEHYPQMVEDFDRHFYSKNEDAYFKCQIMAKRKIFNEYAEYMFGILFYLEKKYKEKIRGQKGEFRFYAFIGERLMSLFICHILRTKKYRVKCLPIAFYGSLNQYQNYRDYLMKGKDEYKGYLERIKEEEPEGRLRYLYYHQKEDNPKDRRVSLHINYRELNGREYSGLIVKQKFSRYRLNSSQRIDSSDKMLFYGKDWGSRTVQLKNARFWMDGNACDKISYRTSGSLDIYDAYIVQWAEPWVNYHPADSSLGKKLIFVIRYDKENRYMVSDRLDLCTYEDGEERCAYVKGSKAEKGEVLLTKTLISESVDERPVSRSCSSVAAIECGGDEMTLSIQREGFYVGGEQKDSIRLMDWNGDAYTAFLAEWYHIDVAKPIL